MERKTPCAPIVDEQDIPEEKKGNPKCKFCGRVFSSTQTMYQHMRKYCKIVPRNGDTSGMDKLYDHVMKRQEAKLEKQEAEMKKMAEQIKQLLDQGGIGSTESKEIEQLSAIPPSTAISQSGNKNALVNVNKGMIDQSTKSVKVTNNNIINIFGSENTSHITKADILKILKEMGPLGPDLRPVAEKVILQTAMLIHSDEKHPENITCYIPNQKGKNIMVHGPNGWEMMPGSLALSPMAHTAVDELFDKQPYAGDPGAPENMDDITAVMSFIGKNEGSLVGDAAKPGSEFRAIGIRNKSILEKILPKLPAVGDA